MKANKTALKGLPLDAQLQFSNTILLDFVNLTYDAWGGSFTKSSFA
jgi:hypothetical protein